MGKRKTTSNNTIKTQTGIQIPEGTTIIDEDDYELELRKKREIQRKRQEAAFEGISISPTILVQCMILLATLHASYVTFGSEPFQLIWKLIIFIGAQVLRRFNNKQKKILEAGDDDKNKSKEKTTVVNSGSKYKFETVYVCFLPFMLSLLFFPDLININTVLMLNVFDGSLLTRSVIQLFFLMFTSQQEIVLLRNFTAIVLNVGFHYLLATVSELKSLDNVECNLFSILLTNVLYLARRTPLEGKEINLPYNVLWGTLVAFLLTVGLNYMISMPFGNKKYKHIRSLVLFTTFVITFPLLINQYVVVGNGSQSPIMWLFEYIKESNTRQNILIIWLSFLFVLIPNILIFKSNFSLNTSRKLWHFLILALIIQPFQRDPIFVKISLGGTIVLFLAVEYLRYLKLEPLGQLLDSKLRSFADFRDERGPIIISYIYLIIGITTPLLIANSPVGLISLGVGDSTASIIGKKYGEMHWPNSRKTIEGTMAFILTTFAVGYLCKEYLGYFENLDTNNWLLVCTLSGVLEGNSILNDNILIPAFMLICEKLFTVQL